MQISILERADDRLRLLLRDVPLSVGNALRRFIINEVPVMAVEEVLVIENTSSMMNEVLTYRISLIPFCSDIDNYVLPEKCDCGNKLGCSRCVARFSLRAEATDQPYVVYSRDIQPEVDSEVIRPVSGDFPIVKLSPGQRIELELYVRLGKGRRHAKWQPGISTLYEGDGGRVLYVESFGFLPTSRMVSEAAKIFEETINELQRAVGSALIGEKNEGEGGEIRGGEAETS